MQYVIIKKRTESDNTAMAVTCNSREDLTRKIQDMDLSTIRVFELGHPVRLREQPRVVIAEDNCVEEEKEIGS